ncbi:murein L,D-transpeptidase catalytic domain family protein [Pseudoflavitalea sp. X16]|nr:murein L,D-transpeptidase catalytic domain family protein [Paraflavitalea devenefica]
MDPAPAAVPVAAESKAVLYDSLRLDTLALSRDAFSYALQGYKTLQAAGELANQRILTIIDFSLPSAKKRLFVVDMASGKLLFNTWVSHGRNSGTDMATRFSNRNGSLQSSLGFYITGDTYNGGNGYSLKLDGQEKGINDNALLRKIVMHGSAYVNERVIAAKGYIGRSLGCPAIPAPLTKTIINTIRNGSCLFIYSPDSNYITRSKILAPVITDTLS